MNLLGLWLYYQNLEVILLHQFSLHVPLIMTSICDVLDVGPGGSCNFIHCIGLIVLHNCNLTYGICCNLFSQIQCCNTIPVFCRDPGFAGLCNGQSSGKSWPQWSGNDNFHFLYCITMHCNGQKKTNWSSGLQECWLRSPIWRCSHAGPIIRHVQSIHLSDLICLSVLLLKVECAC